jgi:multimeric flavodoxin WrbA
MAGSDQIDVYVINGSSRTGGETARYLAAIAASVQDLGHRSRMIHLVRLGLAPCDGRLTPPLRADFRPLFQRLERADAIVFGTPTYWFSMSALMKNFLERLLVAEQGWPLEGKVAGYLATGSRHEDGAMIALSSLAATTNHLGMVTFP